MAFESIYLRAMILLSLRQHLRWLGVCIQLDMQQDGKVTDAREEIGRFREQLMFARLTHREKRWLKAECRPARVNRDRTARGAP